MSILARATLDLLECLEAVGASLVRRGGAVDLQGSNRREGRGCIVVGGDIEGVGAIEGSYVVEPYAAEAEYRIAGSIGAGDVYTPGLQRALQAVHARLRIVGK